MTKSVKKAICLLLSAVSLIAFTGCVVINPETIPGSALIQDSDVDSIQSPSQESTQPYVMANNETYYPSSTTEPPRLQLLINNNFTLGESLIEEDGVNMLPGIDENATLEFPFLMNNVYYGESFFLSKGEVVHLELWTDSPASFWKGENYTVWINVGPSAEYMGEWKHTTGYDDVNWDTAPDFVTQRSSGGWISEITFVSPLSGYYAATLLNLTKNAVECDLEISVEVD